MCYALRPSLDLPIGLVFEKFLNAVFNLNTTFPHLIGRTLILYSPGSNFIIARPSVEQETTILKSRDCARTRPPNTRNSFTRLPSAVLSLLDGD